MRTGCQRYVQRVYFGGMVLRAGEGKQMVAQGGDREQPAHGARGMSGLLAATREEQHSETDEIQVQSGSINASRGFFLALKLAVSAV